MRFVLVPLSRFHDLPVSDIPPCRLEAFCKSYIVEYTNGCCNQALFVRHSGLCYGRQRIDQTDLQPLVKVATNGDLVIIFQTSHGGKDPDHLRFELTTKVSVLVRPKIGPSLLSPKHCLFGRKSKRSSLDQMVADFASDVYASRLNLSACPLRPRRGQCFLLT